MEYHFIIPFYISPLLPYLCGMNYIDHINEYIQPEREVLLKHPLYAKIKSIEDLNCFTEGHVYAVWDFMSLLKALQIELTCVSTPWFASDYPNTRYLINEIVLAEESDEYIDGSRLSHFEMYIDAMSTMGADCSKIFDFLDNIKQHQDIFKAIDSLKEDDRIKAFLKFSFDIIATKEPHKIASAFTFGREDLIPAMFTSILKEIQHNFPKTDLSKFIYYFQRHIELDGDEHGPLAMQMIQELGSDEDSKWTDMKIVAKEALQKRIALWDAIHDNLLVEVESLA